MFDLKRFARIALILTCCVACLLAPASAFSSLNGGEVPEAPAVSGDTVVASPNGHLVTNVYYSPYASATVIGCFEDGTQVTVLGTKKNFYKVDCYDMVGYIPKDQLVQDENGDFFVRANEESSHSKYLPSYSVQSAMKLKSELVAASKKYIGVRYVSGGTTPRGFDCSGYTQYVFREVGIKINRNVRTQLSNGIIVAKEDLQAGDLIIFSNTSSRGFASHVGIYLGNGKLIHASETKGITIVELSNSYFTKHYECARRVILSDLSPAATMPTVNSIIGAIGSGWRSGE